MKLELAQPLALYLLVLTALGTVASAGYFSNSIMVAIVVAMLGSLFVPKEIRSELGASRVLGVVLVVLFAALGYDVVVRGGDVVGDASTFLVVVLVSRLYTGRTTVEARQILLLSLLVVLAGSALSTSFSFAPYFIGFIVCSVWALTTTQLEREVEARRKAGQPEASLQVRISGRYLLTTSLLSVVIFIQASAFFIAFPRLGIGYFRLAQRPSKQTVGYNDKVELGASGNIEESLNVVMRLEFENANQQASSLYFRGATLSEFDGRRWSRLSSGFSPLKMSADGLIHLRGRPDPHAISYKLAQEPSDIDSLVLPEQTTSFTLRRELGAPPIAGLRLVTSQGLDVIASRPPNIGLRVEGWLSPDTGVLPLRAPNEAETALPKSIDPRISELAKELAQGETATSVLAAKFMNHLHQFNYTTNLTAPPENTDPIAYFLFDTRAGHCEYFASALAVLLRTQGVATRLVSGYLGASYNRYGNYWFVTENRAHSWVEYFNPQLGWVRVDPTPPSGQPPTRTHISMLNEMLDVTRYRWNRYVLEFNLDTQLSAVKTVQQAMRDNKEGWKEAPQAVHQMWSEHRTTFLLTAVLLLLGWLYWLQRKIVRRKITAPTRLYRRYRKFVLGGNDSDTHTPIEVAAMARNRFPTLVDPINEMTEAYLQARFGGELQRVATMKRAWKQIRQAHSASR